MTKKTFRVLDMHCANCSMRIESIEDDLPGISGISASYHKQQVVVDYDESVVTDVQILEAVKKKGYQAVLF
jgi:copper chaperone CopZ